jgi:hypothetical protein
MRSGADNVARAHAGLLPSAAGSSLVPQSGGVERPRAQPQFTGDFLEGWPLTREKFLQNSFHLFRGRSSPCWPQP